MKNDNTKQNVTPEEVESMFKSIEESSSEKLLKELEELRTKKKEKNSDDSNFFINANKSDQILKESYKEFSVAFKAYLAYEQEQKKLNPQYSIWNPIYRSDARKFDLVWVDYTEAISKRRGKDCVFSINGTNYHFSLLRPTLVLIDHLPRVEAILMPDHFSSVPSNQNRLSNLTNRAREDYLLSIAKTIKLG